MADVLCLGILVADVVGKPVDKWPEKGKLDAVDRIELHTGGCAANTGISLAKIGVDVAIVGKVGDDGFGEFMVSRLSQNGINASRIVRDKVASTSCTMVMVDSQGERTFIHCFGANATLREEDIDIDYIKRQNILHVAGTFLMPGFDGQPTANVLKAAKEAGVTTCLDTCWDSRGNWMKLLEPCLPYMDYFVPSYDEAVMLSGREDPREIAQLFMDKGVGTVAIKMGDRGCYMRDANNEITVPIYRVNCVDALGAGDAFAAGFLTGLVNGWDLERTGKFANAVGAFCVTALGATTGIKDQATIEAFIADRERVSC